MSARLAAVLLAACAAGGCASLADRIIAPPDQAARLGAADAGPALGIGRSRLQVADGITLAYRTVPVATRALRYRYRRNARVFALDFDAAPTTPPVAPPPLRGTVIYLHGWGFDGSSMLPWALALAQQGYAGIAVDLRGHGGSSRAPEGFGPREAGDIVALVDRLRAKGSLAEPVYLFGVSYGASAALFAERGLRGRIAGIVAMEPFANAADAIRTMVPALRREDATRPFARAMSALTRRRYDAAAVERAIAETNRRLGLDLDAIDLREPLAQSCTCTLLLHGARDTWLPVAGARRLARAAPDARYLELPDENHLSLPLRIDWLAAPVAAWLQQAGTGRCEGLVLPPDPAGVLPAAR
ncbi:MAG: alpha/beta fold hydrolase [Lysobacter sp.]|nr:alpha/beta fold hydrolase [Lysobacter sp.]